MDDFPWESQTISLVYGMIGLRPTDRFDLVSPAYLDAVMDSAILPLSSGLCSFFSLCIWWKISGPVRATRELVKHKQCKKSSNHVSGWFL